MPEAPDNFYVLLLIATGGVLLLAVIPLLLVITFRNRTLRQERKLQAAALQHQKALLQATVQSQEQERNHIGIELHDNIINSMMLLNLQIQNADREQALAHSENIVQAIRSLSHGLSPVALRLFGLREAVVELAEQLQENAGMQIDWRVEDAETLSAVPRETALHIYRIVQELVTNTIKHAKASKVGIYLERQLDVLLLEYNDNGVGFLIDNTAARHHGLYSIESRLELLKAEYNWSTAPGEGMQLRARFIDLFLPEKELL